MTKDWSAEEAFQKMMTRNMSSPINVPAPNVIQKRWSAEDQIPISVLEETLEKAAQIVLEHGEKYLCYFERIERELDAAKSKLDTMEKIHRIAAYSNNHISNDILSI